MSFTKFMSLLDQSALYFSRVDRLGDPFEGSYGQRNLSGNLRPEEMIGVYKSMEPGSKRIDWGTHSPEDRKRAFQLGQSGIFANCWHMNEHESAAMWSVYARIGEGVAVQSTYRRLRDSFVSPDHKQRVTIGIVTYIDYDVDAVPESSVLYPYLYKRKSFEHERELRALTFGWPMVGVKTPAETKSDPGKRIDIELATLIEAIYVAPSCPDWFTGLVQSMLRRFDLNPEIRVINSRILQRPVY